MTLRPTDALIENEHRLTPATSVHIRVELWGILERSALGNLRWLQTTVYECRNATKRLNAVNAAINYGERIFTSLKELLDAKF